LFIQQMVQVMLAHQYWSLQNFCSTIAEFANPYRDAVITEQLIGSQARTV